jgi:hypothetical protein
MPPHLFLPPYKSHINDFLPSIISFLPFSITVKLGLEKYSVMSVIYYFVLNFWSSSAAISSFAYYFNVSHCLSFVNKTVFLKRDNSCNN